MPRPQDTIAAPATPAGTAALAVAAIGGVSGLFEGNAQLVVTQVIAVAFTVAFAATGTVIIMTIVNVLFGARVPQEHEEIGLDLAVHGEVAYQS